MNVLIEEPIKFSKFNKLVKDIEEGKENLSILGLTDSQNAHMVYSLYNYSKKNPVIVCPNVSSAKKMIQDLKFYSETEIVYFPAREIIYYESDIESREIENARVYCINKILSKEKCIIVTTVEALMQRMPPISAYENKTLKIKVSEEISLEDIARKLIELGYCKKDIVESKGEFAVRGGIIDIFDVNQDNPYRVELFGNEVDSIREFDVETQKSTNTLTDFTLSFSNEYIIKEESINEAIEKLQNEQENYSNDIREKIREDIEKIQQNGPHKIIYQYFELFFKQDIIFLDYLEDRIVYFVDSSRCFEREKGIIAENNETLKIMIDKNIVHPKYMFKYDKLDEIEKKYNHLLTVYLDRINKDRNLHAKRKEYSFSCREVNFFRSSMDVQINEIKKYLNGENLVILVFSSLKKVETIKNVLVDNGITIKQVYSLNEIDSSDRNKAYILNGIVSSGFVYSDMNIVLLAEDISGTNIKNTKKHSKEFLGEMLNSYNDLSIGDYVVHETHGIGKYLGVETVETYGTVRDYIKIEYKDGGVLYVPITSLEYVKKYVCDEGFVPKINKLGTKEWEKTKYKVGKHIKDIAKDLIQLYAKREQQVGYAFDKDTPWQNEFESDFEYELTEDQKRCIEEVKKDMEQNRPMDRLLCGDVGYGKTEVAIRGAFKAVMSGKQVAYLVPTTVLCLQQYNVFKHRMEDYGIRVEMLSRFKTPKEQKEILEKLESGDIDVVVGTHRLLSKDIKYKDLGFLIIDEEHRFGVEHKETIKKYKVGIDVLSMTATPIPRTLHMSMIGIRDVSVILNPPQERMPVHTYVMGYDDEIIKQAIEKELDRDGQVFYLSNRVENIEEIADKVKRLVPYARVEYAHGQMPAKQVEDIMLKFMDKELNVLVCTTILESGIDIPNANTIVVENADKLGLAQLYQIRGRVGRSNKMAYAYVTYNKHRTISEDAEKRLVAIKDYTEFGSGIKIALRDLEIRGAGNLLGAEQHGHIADIGYEMYSAMLERAIKEEQNIISGIKDEQSGIDYLKNDVKITMDVSANIPDSYISSSKVKIEMYQKLSNANTEEKLREVTLELIDRFGNIPAQTENLISVIEIRNMCKALNITELKCNCEHFVILPYNLKFRLTKSSKHDILLTIKATLKDMIKSRDINGKGED